jgi:hypothetical protein
MEYVQDACRHNFRSVERQPGVPGIRLFLFGSRGLIATALLKERLQRKIVEEVATLILWLSSDETYFLSTVFDDSN